MRLLLMLSALAAAGCGDDGGMGPDEPGDDPEPTTVEDPVDPAVDPSLDIRSCDAAHSESGEAWFACDMEGAWPPADTLYSWYVRMTIQDSDGTELHGCVFQRHDGVEMTFCGVGSEDDLSVRHSTTGFVSVFANAQSMAGSRFSIEAGMALDDTGNIQSNFVSGTFGEDPVPAPQSN